MRRVGKSLEERCRDLLTATWNHSRAATPATLLERELALTLDHIEGLRHQNQHSRFSLDHLRCDIESRMLNLQPLPRHYVGYRWAQQQQMINQLTNARVRLEESQRRLLVEYGNRMRELHDRLLELLNMREQVREDDGDSADRP